MKKLLIVLGLMASICSEARQLEAECHSTGHSHESEATRVFIFNNYTRGTKTVSVKLGAAFHLNFDRINENTSEATGHNSKGYYLVKSERVKLTVFKAVKDLNDMMVKRGILTIENQEAHLVCSVYVSK